VAQLSVRKVDDDLVIRLKERAARADPALPVARKC
jgi:hypothetical protein